MNEIAQALRSVLAPLFLMSALLAAGGAPAAAEDLPGGNPPAETQPAEATGTGTGARAADGADTAADKGSAGQKPAEGATTKEEKPPEKKGFWKSLFPKILKKWPPGSIAGHFYFSVGIGTGIGLISGKAYGDNPKTPDIEDDGPSVTNRSAQTGLVTRFGLGYIMKKGLGFALFARYQLSNGSSVGYDTKFDAWIIGLRVLRLIYVRKQLNILPFLGVGYGKMRHVVESVILPKGRSGDFYKASGNFDVGVGLEFLYRFTPVFNLVVDLVGDVMFPATSVNLDAVIGLALTY